MFGFCDIKTAERGLSGPGLFSRIDRELMTSYSFIDDVKGLNP